MALEPTEHRQSLLSEFPDEQGDPTVRVGLDALDRLPIKVLPEAVGRAALQTLAAATTAISIEGARGAACRRLLAREIQLARVQLRVFQGLLNSELTSGKMGPKANNRIRLLERIVDRQHRRLMATIDQLARLDPPAPAVHVSAHQAAVLVEVGGRP